MLKCDWCGYVCADDQAVISHSEWHIEFLMGQKSDAALSILEDPIPFSEVTP